MLLGLKKKPTRKYQRCHLSSLFFSFFYIRPNCNLFVSSVTPIAVRKGKKKKQSVIILLYTPTPPPATSCIALQMQWTLDDVTRPNKKETKEIEKRYSWIYKRLCCPPTLFEFSSIIYKARQKKQTMKTVIDCYSTRRSSSFAERLRQRRMCVCPSLLQIFLFSIFF